MIWGNDLGLEEKRRKIGRFIGLSGCESPIRTEKEIMRSEGGEEGGGGGDLEAEGTVLKIDLG